MNWTCHTPRFVARKCFESCGVRYAVQVSIDVVVGICVICSRWLELYTAYCAKKSVDLTTTLFDTENALEIEQMADWRIVLKPLMLRFLAQVNSFRYISIHWWVWHWGFALVFAGAQGCVCTAAIRDVQPDLADMVIWIYMGYTGYVFAARNAKTIYPIPWSSHKFWLWFLTLSANSRDM